MMKNYQKPEICVEVLSAEEIRTDVIVASRPTNTAGGVDRMSWADFIA